MEEQYVNALRMAITTSFPKDIIFYIHDQLKKNSPTFYIGNFMDSFCGCSTIKVFETLFELGFDINYQLPKNGSTLLMCVAQSGYCDVAKFLLNKGANIYIKNIAGKTCFDYAEEKGGSMKVLFENYKRDFEKNELMKKNEALERQCMAMNEKMDALFQMLGQMNISADDLIHKKTKMETD